LVYQKNHKKSFSSILKDFFVNLNHQLTPQGIIFFVMKTPKKPTKKSEFVDPEEEMEDSQEQTAKITEFEDDDDDFDMPLDDLDTFDNFGDDDDDDY